VNAVVGARNAKMASLTTKQLRKDMNQQKKAAVRAHSYTAILLESGQDTFQRIGTFENTPKADFDDCLPRIITII
jgi:hypothetical protein